MMQARVVAALYDIHGNISALDAALAEIAAIGADLLVIGGDVAAGPFPAATLARLMGLPGRVRFVRGNADRAMVAAYDCPDDALGADPDDIWAAARLTRDQRDFLASFEKSVTVEIAGVGATCFCHGSPRSDEEIMTRVTPAERLIPALAETTATVVVCGHTHVQYDRTVGDRRVINAGSVGRPYEDRPGAYWALLGPGIELRRTEYNYAAAIATIAASGYPEARTRAPEIVSPAISADVATAHFEQRALKRAAPRDMPR